MKKEFLEKNFHEILQDLNSKKSMQGNVIKIFASNLIFESIFYLLGNIRVS